MDNGGNSCTRVTCWALYTGALESFEAEEKKREAPEPAPEASVETATSADSSTAMPSLEDLDAPEELRDFLQRMQTLLRTDAPPPSLAEGDHFDQLMSRMEQLSKEVEDPSSTSDDDVVCL